jgi:hypothetical protein
MPTPGALFGMIVFGAIGMAAFVYGKKSTLIKPMILGVALMVFPYFVSEGWPLYGIGVLLTAALFYPKA